MSVHGVILFFSLGQSDHDLIRACIRSSLYVNHFLHFVSHGMNVICGN